MIRKSLALSFVLLLAYHFILPRLSQNYYWVPGQARSNYVRAQQFIHNSPLEAKVLVGSSMANELSQEILGKEFVKLTFPAGGSFTGLDIICRSDKRPSLVLIESNTLLRETDEVLLDDVTSSWRRELRDVSSVFKEEGRPSNYQVGFVVSLLKRIDNGIYKLIHGKKKPAPVTIPPMDSSVLEGVMQANRKALDAPPEEAEITARIKRLGDLVEQLTQKGTHCVFFEMPVNSTLKNLAEPAAVRNAMQARFPRDRYTWLDFDHSRDYETSDGIHLVRTEADELTRKITAQTAGLKP